MKKTIYNEDSYLSGDPSIIQHFEKSFAERENVWLIEKLYYQEALEKYEQFIAKVADLIRSLGYKNSLESSFCLSYLIHNGYLSHDLSFSDLPPDQEKEITCRFGINIVLGDGCCRNYSGMHRDVFQKLGLSSENLYCYQGNHAFNIPKQSRANHVINLINYEGLAYGIDLYNLNNLFHFINPFSLAEISTTRRTLLRYKPYTEIEYGESTFEDILEKIKRFEEYASKRAINPFDYEANLKYELKRRIRREEDLYQDFHEETKLLKKEIKESVDEVNRGLYK